MYVLLKRQNLVPRTPVDVEIDLLPIDGSYALDIETRGLDASDPTSEILGIGLADERGCYYIDLRTARPEKVAHLKKLVMTAKLTMFNAMFDATFLQVWAGKWPNVVGDSYALFKQLSGESFQGQSWSLNTAIQDVLGWPVSSKTTMDGELKARGLTKADLWQLPPEVLAPYCAGDADAAWQLWNYLTAVCADYPQVLDYHTRIFLPQVRLLAEQQLRGLLIDKEIITACHTALLKGIAATMDAFLTNPQVAHHVADFNGRVEAAWMAAQPPALTAKGEPSKRWEAWRDRKDRLPWFNPNSKPQLAALFYGTLGYKCEKFTPTGRPVVDRKALPSLGEPGKLLSEMNLLVKRRGYVERVIDKAARDGMIHPQFNSVGTVTTRLGGSGGLNLQQLYKEPSFLAAFTARPGYVLVQADAEALEPTILAEFSQDKTLLQLYGPEAKFPSLKVLTRYLTDAGINWRIVGDELEIGDE